MHLSELVGLRPVPCAGLLLTLTRRCPLSCAHCSTSSTREGEEPGAARLRRFVGSFTAEDRPELVMLTGGEPLLLPELAAELAATARTVGTRSALLSGMFFARDGRIPDRIMRAITAVDHFSASLDVHHEREVPRAGVFRAMHRVLDAGIPVSFHLTGTGEDDPYLAGLTAEIRREFADRAPMLVNRVRPLGRAASWAAASAVVSAARPGAGPGAGPDPGRALPCAMAAWPVVAFDGTVLACCNQQAVDGRPVPEHLRLGHLAEDDWAAVRRRSLASPVLRMIRTVGPSHLYARYAAGGCADPGSAAPGSAAPGYCSGCRRLSDHPEVVAGATQDASGALGELLDQLSAARQTAAGPVELVRRHGGGRHAALVALSGPPPSPGSGSGP